MLNLSLVCVSYACIVDMYLNPPREMVELNPLPLIEQHPELFVSHDFCSAGAPDVWVTLVLQIQMKSTYLVQNPQRIYLHTKLVCMRGN